MTTGYMMDLSLTDASSGRLFNRLGMSARGLAAFAVFFAALGCIFHGCSVLLESAAWLSAWCLRSDSPLLMALRVPVQQMLAIILFWHFMQRHEPAISPGRREYSWPPLLSR